MFLPPADDWVTDLESKNKDKTRLGKPKKEKERIADIQVGPQTSFSIHPLNLRLPYGI